MLSTNFKNANQLGANYPLSDEQLRRVAPSIFAQEAHSSRSERYAYIPTVEVLSKLRNEGFQPFFVAQSRTRVEGKREFTKHLLRLRHVSAKNDKGEAHEVIMINSHDGSSSYQLMSGVFRFVCMNGMVCGETFEDFRIMHTGKIVDQVIDASYQILEQSQQIAGAIDGMKALQLSAPEQTIFAEAAVALRYPDAEQPPVTPNQMLRSRRSEDQGPDLWRTFNRVQENAIRGGLNGAAAHGRRAKTRTVEGIDQSTSLNRALWMVAEKMRELKAA